METEELNKHVKDWAEIFHSIIPEDKLRECYVLAEQNPNRNVYDRNFPLRRREILDAWYKLQAATAKQIQNDCKFCKQSEDDPTLPPCPFHHEKS